MTVVCPQCGSRNIRYSSLRGVLEKMASLAGIRPLRCRDCRKRFTGRVWSLSALRYAHCPKCLRTDLTSWSPSHYFVPFRRGVLLFLGAHPYRCEYCRHNFVSFKPRKHRSALRRHRTPGDVHQTTSVGSQSKAKEAGQ
jgi:DNA-directed RNA polymerase subunit RPC12/RpoP